jgi:anti-sigma-K factor RskA
MNETEHDRIRDGLAAYALRALDLDEAADLERHLAGCQECRTELEWLRPAVQLLPESVERLQPPPRLRERLMGQVEEEARRPGPRARGLDNLHKRDSRRLALLRPLAALATLLIVAGVAAYAISSGDSGDGDATTVAAGQTPGVTAEMVRDGGSGTLHLAHLRQLPADEVLQAWVQRGERVESAKTLFVPNPDGTASATIDDMDGVTTVMVTAEPRGGSTQPTSVPIVSVSIPQ